LQQNNGYKIQVWIRDNHNTWTISPWYPIADSPNLIRFTWNSTRIQGRTSHDISEITLWINNKEKISYTNIENYGQTTGEVLLGSITAPNNSNPSHTIYIDEFEYEGPHYLRP
jgi:hypothetical protein